MEWAWIDLESATLTVPAETMKRKKTDKANGTPHVVPLAPQAVVILRELHPLTGHGRYVFPSLLTGERCMSENTVRSALRRMGYGNDDMTAHGFRAMARTMIAERLGIAPEVIEAQLAHAVADSLGRAYNRTHYIEQRRLMMAKWATYLDQLRDGAQVIPLRRHEQHFAAPREAEVVVRRLGVPRQTRFAGQGLIEHEDETVSALAGARIRGKSTIEQTRMEHRTKRPVFSFP